ncbi:MAG: hypothetical protein U1E96_14925 [Azonexus sp.]
MDAIWLWAGRLAGFLGLALCLFSASGRLGGYFWLIGFQTGTLLLTGTASMVAGCFFLLLHVASARRQAGL